jgi:phosphatidylserine decarboxylase
MKRRRVLLAQLSLLGLCAAALLQFGMSFPYPGPLIRPLLGPRERWPEQQVREWAVRSREENARRGNPESTDALHFRSDFWAYFTRDPERTPPPGPGIVAPADGLFRFHDKSDGVQFVVVALSFWDVHVQRFPCDGLVTKIEDQGDSFTDGEGENLIYLAEKVCPVQKVVTLQTEWGEFKIRLITSISATRLKVFVAEGARVKKGQRLGQILAGSTVVLEMPSSIPLSIELGSRVVAGETVVSGGKSP